MIAKTKILLNPLASRKAKSTSAPGYDIIAIGASAGGLHALEEVLRLFSSAFDISVVVVQHLMPLHKSMGPELLGRHTAMQVKQAQQGETLLPGVVYLAPPDKHLLCLQGKVRLTHTERVRFSGPAIDSLFESVAAAYGPRCIGVILTGSGSDGSNGVRAIKKAGGRTFAQDPHEAEFGAMPGSAIATGCIDFVLPLAEIGPALNRIIGSS